MENQNDTTQPSSLAKRLVSMAKSSIFLTATEQADLRTAACLIQAIRDFERVQPEMAIQIKVFSMGAVERLLK